MLAFQIHAASVFSLVDRGQQPFHNQGMALMIMYE
jgi:hypothetical protein